MTNDVYLLDTSAAIALLNNNPAIDIVLGQAEMFISSISLGELYYGAEKSGRVEANLRRVDEFVAQRLVLI